MRAFGTWGATVLLAGLTATAWAGDKPKAGPRPPSWRTHTVWEKAVQVWTGDPLDEDKKPDVKKSEDKKPAEKAAKKDAPAPAKTEVVADPAMAERSRAEAAFLRRSAACLKLRDIAIRNNDSELLHRADQLDELTWATYTEKAATAAEHAGEPAKGKAADTDKARRGEAKEVKR